MSNGILGAAIGSPDCGERMRHMSHEYYLYTKEQLLANGPKAAGAGHEKDNAQVFSSMAREMAEEIKAHNAAGEKTVLYVLCRPGGTVIRIFVDMVNRERISLKKCMVY